MCVAVPDPIAAAYNAAEIAAAVLIGDEALEQLDEYKNEYSQAMDRLNEIQSETAGFNNFYSSWYTNNIFPQEVTFIEHALNKFASIPDIDANYQRSDTAMTKTFMSASDAFQHVAKGCHARREDNRNDWLIEAAIQAQSGGYALTRQDERLQQQQIQDDNRLRAQAFLQTNKDVSHIAGYLASATEVTNQLATMAASGVNASLTTAGTSLSTIGNAVEGLITGGTA